MRVRAAFLNRQRGKEWRVMSARLHHPRFSAGGELSAFRAPAGGLEFWGLSQALFEVH